MQLLELVLWNNSIPKIIFVLLNKIFSSNQFYDSVWMEIIKKGIIKKNIRLFDIQLLKIILSPKSK
jgi:hypothetical protein